MEPDRKIDSIKNKNNAMERVMAGSLARRRDYKAYTEVDIALVMTALLLISPAGSDPPSV